MCSSVFLFFSMFTSYLDQLVRLCTCVVLFVCFLVICFVCVFTCYLCCLCVNLLFVLFVCLLVIWGSSWDQYWEWLLLLSPHHHHFELFFVILLFSLYSLPFAPYFLSEVVFSSICPVFFFLKTHCTHWTALAFILIFPSFAWCVHYSTCEF